MDLGSAIMGAILIAICIVPFILMSRSRKNGDKQMLQSLTNIAGQRGCQIDQHESCGDFCIGLDEKKNFLFFYKKTKDKVNEQFIDLADIQNCKIVNTSRTISNKDGNYKVIDRLDLNFIPITKNSPGIMLEFFKADVDLQLYGQLQSIEKWSKLINGRLNGRK